MTNPTPTDPVQILKDIAHTAQVIESNLQKRIGGDGIRVHIEFHKPDDRFTPDVCKQAGLNEQKHSRFHISRSLNVYTGVKK